MSDDGLPLTAPEDPTAPDDASGATVSSPSQYWPLPELWRGSQRLKAWADAEDTTPVRTSVVPWFLLIGFVVASTVAWTTWQVHRHRAFGTFGFDFGIF